MTSGYWKGKSRKVGVGVEQLCWEYGRYKKFPFLMLIVTLGNCAVVGGSLKGLAFQKVGREKKCCLSSQAEEVGGVDLNY